VAGAAVQNNGVDRYTTTFRILRGALGPVPACRLEIKPLTVFIGRQGTGKSLVAQVLYFFEELPYLAAFVEASERDATTWSDARVARHLLDRLRSSNRAFGTFANPSVSIDYVRSVPYSKLFDGTKPLRFNAQSANRVIAPNEALRTLLHDARQHDGEKLRRAIFFPTERMVISQLLTAMSEKLLSLPLTFTLFKDWIELASQTIGGWKAGQPESEEAKWVAARSAEALDGHVVRRKDQWKWRYGKGAAQQFDIDMASSGQRANWSLGYVAQALFSLREDRSVSRQITLFVEEPEIHLHPAAQVEILRILAYLVNHGFRVVVTTHSLSLLYALNNLVQAHALKGDGDARLPEKSVRLSPDDVAVYGFKTGEAPQSLVEPKSGFISEAMLGGVADDLSAELNRISLKLARQDLEGE
jgi:hypothetical protein